MLSQKAKMRMEYIKEKKPGLYRELEEAGELDQHCQELAERAEKQKRNLIELYGKTENEADEIVNAELCS